MASTGVIGSTLVKNLRDDHVSALDLRPLCTAVASSPIRDVVGCMIERRAGCVVIVQGDGRDRVVGIFTEHDFVNRVVAQSLDVARPVEHVMTPNPTTVKRNATVLSAIEAMGTGGYRHLPVTDDEGRPVGVLSVKDVVHYLVEYFPAKVYNLPPTPDVAKPAREGA